MNETQKQISSKKKKILQKRKPATLVLKTLPGDVESDVCFHQFSPLKQGYISEDPSHTKWSLGGDGGGGKKVGVGWVCQGVG